MLNVTSVHLRSEEKDMIRKYARFVLSRLVRPGILNKSRVTIKVLKKQDISASEDFADLKHFKAWCTYDGTDDFANKKFTIVLMMRSINRKTQKPQIRLKNLLLNLGHELVHVKQYLLNEMFDYMNGDVRFKGVIFDASHTMEEEKYYFSPWEIAAYGMELGLYRVFCSNLKEEERSKKYK